MESRRPVVEGEQEVGTPALVSWVLDRISTDDCIIDPAGEGRNAKGTATDRDTRRVIIRTTPENLDHP
jgi:hypothetical protein